MLALLQPDLASCAANDTSLKFLLVRQLRWIESSVSAPKLGDRDPAAHHHESFKSVIFIAHERTSKGYVEISLEKPHS